MLQQDGSDACQHVGVLELCGEALREARRYQPVDRIIKAMPLALRSGFRPLFGRQSARLVVWFRSDRSSGQVAHLSFLTPGTMEVRSA
jgi:hypothetical protein